MKKKSYLIIRMCVTNNNLIEFLLTSVAQRILSRDSNIPHRTSHKSSSTASIMQHISTPYFAAAKIMPSLAPLKMASMISCMTHTHGAPITQFNIGNSRQTASRMKLIFVYRVFDKSP